MGTGRIYSLAESQHFGEFGPLLWNLVTTLNGTDRIEHHPYYEWVVWGPLWGGRISGAYEFPETYGVTELDAVDPVAVAAAIPMGKVIRLREVRWSVDDKNAVSELIRDLARSSEVPTLCELKTWSPDTGRTITATTEQIERLQLDLAPLGELMEAVTFVKVDTCVYATDLPLIVRPRHPTDYPPN